MEEMYQKYKDVAEFRMIYIREAHAVDGARPSGIGRQLNIKDHTDYKSRCDVAERLIKDKALTMPMLIDNFENTTDMAYQAKPDRVFLVGSDGRLAVAADRGPFGFKPGLDDCKTWLDKLIADKKEPELSKEVIATADARTEKRGPAKKPTTSKAAPASEPKAEGSTTSEPAVSEPAVSEPATSEPATSVPAVLGSSTSSEKTE